MVAKAKRYELDDSVLGEQKFKGQAALVVRSLLDKHPQTAQEIADDIKGKLQTRQDPLRVVSFYLSTWKKSGLIVVAGNETPVSSGNPGEDPVSLEPSVEEPGTGYPEPIEEPELEVVARSEFDYVNSPLSDAVVSILKTQLADPASPKIIADELNVLGRTVTPKQVSDSVRRLAERGVIAKLGDGRYAAILPDALH